MRKIAHAIKEEAVVLVSWVLMTNRFTDPIGHWVYNGRRLTRLRPISRADWRGTP